MVTPQETHQQNLWNERNRIRRLWLNSNYDESSEVLQRDIFETIKTVSSADSYTEYIN